MNLVRLIYASSLKKDIDPSINVEIIKKSKIHNTQRSITGLLCFGSDYFLQCLEGGRDEVNLLYSKIISDQRHERIVLIDYSEISERQFDRWSMGLMLMTRDRVNLILRHSSSEDFDPYAMPSANALRFLLALRSDDT